MLIPLTLECDSFPLRNTDYWYCFLKERERERGGEKETRQARKSQVVPDNSILNSRQQQQQQEEEEEEEEKSNSFPSL